jgi:energy-coupling factor transporter ATP-binding protein EcfA2
MMTFLADIIEINAQQTDSAIVFDRDSDNQHLIHSFSPTTSAIQIFNHFSTAVLPQATQEQRAINLHGPYGSGKSHLAVVLAQLLRDGSGAEGFAGLFERIKNFSTAKTADDLKNTFLPADDKDAKPYLLVSLYGSECTSISDKLMEGLCEALKRHPDLNLENILPKTEYDVCVSCFKDMIANTPDLANADLPMDLIRDYLTTRDMLRGLEHHEAPALQVFKDWYRHIVHGRSFNPANEGGKNFIEAYVEAGKNLAQKHHFGGIVVVWDEFGFALEDLISNSQRNAQQEIKALESFVQTACSPALGHTIFIGLTHVSFPEYADRTGANQTVKNNLEQITGRFKTFKVELNAAESEGYHLLGMQRTWTERGKQLLAAAVITKQALLENCRQLALFNQLGDHLDAVLQDVYPLHPIMAAGLFALSGQAAQSNRTALTFFRDNAPEFLHRELNTDTLFKAELIRLPTLVDYYEWSLKDKKSTDWERYQCAVGQIPTSLALDDADSKKAILKLCLLAQLLGELFQTTEHFLAVALYDVAYSDRLISDLNWLKAADLLWKNDVTEQWTLSGDAGVDIEALITKELTHFAGRIPQTLFSEYPDMLEDLLPQIGEHDLEPSACGIVRSYRVDLCTPPMTNHLKIDNPLLSAQVFLVLAEDSKDVDIVKARIRETPMANIYFWLPWAGTHAESITVDGKEFKLNGLLCRYLALEQLLKQKTTTEELRRQLTAKWEKNRQQILTVLQILFGRDGLQCGKSQIFKAGTSDALDYKSWHDFRHYLGEVVQASYPSEVPIRAMNMNRLTDEKGRRNKLDIVDRIIKFDDNPDYRTDLLGEPKESSELSALIDGILGANNLFIQRSSGWDLKTIDETQGNIGAVLTLINSTLLRKREQPYLVKKLRDELIAPPYGIPACNLAIFAAVAVRHDVKRLRWVGSKETDFAKDLNEAFEPNSKLTIRLSDFSQKQSTMLVAVGHYFSIERISDQSVVEYSTQCSYRLRDFVKNQSEVVRQSRQLQDKTQKLVKFFDQVGKLPQDTADFLIELCDFKTIESVTAVAGPTLKIIFDDFSKVEDAKRYDIESSWQDFLVQIDPNKADLIVRLTHERATPLAKAVSDLLNAEQMADANALTLALLNKSFSQCNENDIGKCQGQLEMLVDYQPPRPQQPPLLPSETISPNVKLPPLFELTTAHSLIETLRRQIDSTQLSREQIRETLECLLNDYA